MNPRPYRIALTLPTRTYTPITPHIHPNHAAHTSLSHRTYLYSHHTVHTPRRKYTFIALHMHPYRIAHTPRRKYTPITLHIHPYHTAHAPRSYRDQHTHHSAWHHDGGDSRFSRLAHKLWSTLDRFMAGSRSKLNCASATSEIRNRKQPVPVLLKLVRTALEIIFYVLCQSGAEKSVFSFSRQFMYQLSKHPNCRRIIFISNSFDKHAGWFLTEFSVF